MHVVKYFCSNNSWFTFISNAAIVYKPIVMSGKHMHILQTYVIGCVMIAFCWLGMLCVLSKSSMVKQER